MVSIAVLFVDLVNGTKSIVSYLHLTENSMKRFSNYIESYPIKCDDISKEKFVRHKKGFFARKIFNEF